LSDFSSDIAHELRTPVSNLMMQTQFALAKVRDVSHYREILFANLEELKRLSRMTSDMLFLARSEHGLLQLDKHDVNLAEELNELRELFEPLAEETGKTITVEGEGVVAGDSDMLRRAFSNLLSNAIKYSPDNTRTTILIAQGSCYVEVVISNPVSGGVPANLERLFDRFYRVDSSRVHSTEGAGLGFGGSQPGHFPQRFQAYACGQPAQKNRNKDQTDIEPEQPGTEFVHKQGVIPSIRGNRNDDMFAFTLFRRHGNPPRDTAVHGVIFFRLPETAICSDVLSVTCFPMQSSILPITPVQRYTLSVTVTV